MSTSATGQPLAVYTDLDATDFSGGRALLQANGFQVSYLGSQDADTIVSGSRDAVALLVGYATITREMIAEMPRLKIIALMSMGFDNVDVDAATERGIWVTNILGAATEEVATHALALALHVTRGLTFYSDSATNQSWNSRDNITPPRLSECTLGIIGLGRIGLKLATLARPLFGEIIGYDPLLPDTDETRLRLAEVGVRRESLTNVRSGSTVLSLHLPLTPDTEKTVDEDFLAAMRNDAFLVNVSRGALIDSTALANAVSAGLIAGAALDVLDEEPPRPDHPLLGLPRVLITAHVAYLSTRSDAEYVRMQAQNVVSWSTNGTPDTPVATIAA